MAHSHNLPDKTLNLLAKKLSQLLTPSAVVLAKAGGQMEIGETFQVWSLGLSALGTPDIELNKLATNTGYWHHQIRHNGSGTEYARTSPHDDGEEDWNVHAIFSSDLAHKIDSAIDWIDKNVLDDDLVVLLTVPAYFIEAFWLKGTNQDRIFIIDAPSLFEELITGSLYNVEEFLTILAKYFVARQV